MSTTLVGVFDAYDEAQEASRKLEDAGIGRQSIRVESGSTTTAAAPAEDRRGFFAKLFGLGDDDENVGHYSEAVRRGNAVVTVSLDDETRIGEVTDILEDCGAADVDERVEQWKASGYTPTPMAGRSMADDGDETMKSVEEELKIGKREVQQGRVRVHRTMSETPVEEQVTLRDERAAIERKKVDRPATEADLQGAFKDREIEVRETTEEPVVSKSARVVEEVSVGKKGSERTETVRGNVRKTEIDVDNADDVPGSLRDYSGPERRSSRAAYSGVERRSAM